MENFIFCAVSKKNQLIIFTFNKEIFDKEKTVDSKMFGFV